MVSVQNLLSLLILLGLLSTVSLSQQFQQHTEDIRTSVRFGTRSLGSRIHLIVDRQAPEALAPGSHQILGLPDERVLVSVPTNELVATKPVKRRDSHLGARGTTTMDYYLVIFHPDISLADVAAVLLRTAVNRHDHAGLLPQHYVISGTVQQIAELSEWDEVAFVYPASTELIQGLPVTACGGPAVGGRLIGEYTTLLRRKATSTPTWSGFADGKAQLTYTVERQADTLSPSVTAHILGRVLREWSSHVQLQFTPGTKPSARNNINLSFASGTHGDVYPFDGPGRILAHAFYPAGINPEPIAGDVHLDNDESWSEGGATDLFSVLLHEVGHSLGLGHSSNPQSVMYPYYRSVSGIHAVDIDAIRQLYPAAEPKEQAGLPESAEPATLRISLSEQVEFMSNSAVVLRGTVFGGYGDVRVWFTADSFTGIAAGGREWTTPELLLSFGLNEITVIAEDEVGARVSLSVSVRRLPDRPEETLGGRMDKGNVLNQRSVP